MFPSENILSGRSTVWFIVYHRPICLRFGYLINLSRILNLGKQINWLGMECVADALIDKIMNQPLLLKAHFVFGRVYVYIYIIRVKIEKQYESGILLTTQMFGIGLADSVVDYFIPYHSSIDIAIS